MGKSYIKLNLKASDFRELADGFQEKRFTIGWAMHIKVGKNHSKSEALNSAAEMLNL